MARRHVAILRSSNAVGTRIPPRWRPHLPRLVLFGIGSCCRWNRCSIRPRPGGSGAKEHPITGFPNQLSQIQFFRGTLPSQYASGMEADFGVRIRARVTPPWDAAAGLQTGRSDAVVTGIVTAWTPSIDVLRRAVAARERFDDHWHDASRTASSLAGSARWAGSVT